MLIFERVRILDWGTDCSFAFFFLGYEGGGVLLLLLVLVAFDSGDELGWLGV